MAASAAQGREGVDSSLEAPIFGWRYQRLMKLGAGSIGYGARFQSVFAPSVFVSGVLHDRQ
jgi:hypothetical protein